MKAKNILIGAILVVTSFSFGLLLGNRSFEISKDGPKVNLQRNISLTRGNLDFSLFWEVWDTLNASYFDKSKLVDSKMVYGAISGMVEAVGDPYTVFLPPTENKVVQEDLTGNFEGVGIQIGYRGSQLAVIAPLSGTPAEKAGIKAGDFIVGITDERKGIERGTVGINLAEAVELIRGQSGTKVKLTLMRDGVSEPFEVEVKREKIDVPSVVLTYAGENNTIAHVKVLKFAAETEAEWDKAISEISSKPEVKGVIVDVRNNPGGYLQGSVDLASEFIPSSKTIVIEENSKGQKQEYKVTRIGKLLNMPVVILVNKGSASASEIFAGAMRDQKGTKLVGETTFGKGTIQEPMQIENGAGLHVTIARWLTPSGFWVNEKGLEPDVKVEDSQETSEDEQLQEAIKLLQ